MISRANIMRSAAAIVLAGVLAIPAVAFGATDDIDGEPNDLQRAVEATAEEYARATKQVEDLQREIEENAASIEELDDRIEGQRASCSQSLADLYKFNKGGSNLVGIIFSADDLGTFLSTVEYFNRIHEASSESIQRLTDMLQEREDAQASLDQAKADAEKEQARAERAAAQAIAQREAAQAAAVAAAKAEAEERQAGQGAGGASGGGNAAGSGATGSPSVDGADWSQDKASFVNSWAGRLDGYLAGSPLAGQGATFAAAAWDAGIDPRYSAAISEVESSKGRACFMPHNAWGWGSVSWGSWEEAIPSHARGLARGYGYTVSEAAAKKYCPPNWEHWYNRVSQEMAKI